MSCTRCGSSAINHHSHGRDGSDGDLCDVCYWRKRAESNKEDVERDSMERGALKAGGDTSANHVSEAAIYSALVEVLGQPIDQSKVLLSRIAIAIKKHSEAK